MIKLEECPGCNKKLSAGLCPNNKCYLRYSQFRKRNRFSFCTKDFGIIVDADVKIITIYPQISHIYIDKTKIKPPINIPYFEIDQNSIFKLNDEINQKIAKLLNFI